MGSAGTFLKDSEHCLPEHREYRRNGIIVALESVPPQRYHGTDYSDTLGTDTAISAENREKMFEESLDCLKEIVIFAHGYY